MVLTAIRAPLWLEVLLVWLVTTMAIGLYWAYEDLARLQAMQADARDTLRQHTAEKDRLFEAQRSLQQTWREHNVQEAYVQTIISDRQSLWEALRAIEFRVVTDVDVSQLQLRIGEQLTLVASVHPDLTKAADWLDALRDLPPFVGLPQWSPLVLRPVETIPIPGSAEGHEDFASNDFQAQVQTEGRYEFTVSFSKASGDTSSTEDTSTSALKKEGMNSPDLNNTPTFSNDSGSSNEKGGTDHGAHP